MSDLVDPTVAPTEPFWDALAAAMRERRPCVFRKPAGAPVVSAREAFAWAVAVADNLRAGDRRCTLRLHGADGRELAADPERMPRADDGDLAAFGRRFAAHTGGDAGLVVNNIQAGSAAGFAWTRDVLAELLPRIGRPAGGVSCEIFAGAYKRGAFGVHKDDQDVITFVVEGPKRFLLWPYEVFADRPDVAPGSELRTALLSRTPDAPDAPDVPAREHALVIEGGPGDVFYWPAEWWHVAENDGQHCTTLGLGVTQDITLAQLVEDALREAPAGTPESAALRTLPAPDEAVARVVAILADPFVQSRVAAHVTAMHTGFCMKALPAPRPPDDRLDAAAAVRGYPGALLVRPGEDAARELDWSVLGRTFTYPRRAAFERLFAVVGSGAPFVPRDLAHALADREVDASALAHVLDALHRHYALVPALVSASAPAVPASTRADQSRNVS